MNSNQLLAIALVSLTIIAVSTAAVVYMSIEVKGKGTIAAVGLNIFSDPLGQYGVESIDWGVVYPNGTYQVEIWIQSDPDVTTVSGNLTMEVVNWQPPGAENYITVTWNREGYTLWVGDMLDAVITLHVDPAISGVQEFSNTMVFTITG